MKGMMMRGHGILALATLFLGGCAAASQAKPENAPPPPPASERPSPEPLCGAGLYEKYVGQIASDELLASIRETQGSKPVRILKPGSVMTMDYRGDRLNVVTDAAMVITQFRCG